MCWYYLFICVIFCAHLCFVCCLWFPWLWVRSCWFPFCSIFPWNVSFLFSSFRLMSVSKATIYNRITSFFQVIREQVKCMKKYFFSKFHSNSPVSRRSLCLLCLGIIFWLYVCVIEFIENVLISVFGCGFYVWVFICHLLDCLCEVLDFLWTVFFLGMLFLFPRLFIWSRCLVQPLMSI